MKKNLLVLFSACWMALSLDAQTSQKDGLQDLKAPFSIGNLPYAFEALEPVVDRQTMEIHFTKHHNAYVTNLNKAIGGTEMEKMTLGEMMARISTLPVAVRNNGGGHFNHSLFWGVMGPNGTGKPLAGLLKAIEKDFGSFEAFKVQFEDASKSRFGSGWAWLSLDKDGKLFVSSTPNQDNPLMDVAEKKGMPLLGLDVWEHAYYLKYQNKRADYVSAFWNVVNWTEVEKRYQMALKAKL